MNPLAIKASNYRTFESLDVELPSGAVAVLGENGAGKSSLVNIVDLALFGPDGRSWAPYLTQGVAEQRLELELTFEHGEQTFRIRRGYSAAGKGKATLDLEVQPRGTDLLDDLDGMTRVEASVWATLSRESIDATQTHLEELLGLTRETFRASSMLVQGDGAAFTDAAPRDRKRILAKILGLDRFDRLLELARRDLRIAEHGVTATEVKIAHDVGQAELRPSVEAELKRAQERVQACTTALRQAEDAHRVATGHVERLQEQKAAGDVARARLAEAEAKLQPLLDAIHAATVATSTLETVRDELATLATDTQTEALEIRKAELEQIVEGYRHVVIRRDELVRQAEVKTQQKAALNARIRDLGGKLGRLDESIEKVKAGALETCPTCSQALGTTARFATESSLNAQTIPISEEMDALSEQAAAIEIPEVPEIPVRPTEAEAELALVILGITEAHRDAFQRARLEERVGQLEATVRSKPAVNVYGEAEKAVEDAKTAITDAGVVPVEELEQQKAELLRISAEIVTQRGWATEAEKTAIRLSAQLEAIEEAAVRTAEAEAELETHRKRIDLLKILERAYGRDGIPALIVSQAAIPSIELEASRILAELGTSYRVELRTEKALAGGGTADALDVVIVTEDGERPYETFSGGERTRLNLALRIGLARLLASRRGAESRLLAIDEPEFLDEAGTAALAGVLQGLTGDFDKVYLISHVPDLRDRFDASIEVVKGPDGLSRIGGS